MKNSPIYCSVGIMAHNEAKNIKPLLTALAGQELDRVHISEIIVVASGCTDGTEGIVQAMAEKDSRIRLYIQPKREGKASAINLFLSKAREDLVIVESADTIPDKKCVEELVRPLEQDRIGMTGARPIPVNPSKDLLGNIVHLMWRLHHAIALETPKLGEMVAFRKVIDCIPPETCVDEASIEALVTAQGYTLFYAPRAVVFNKGPETVADFLCQRRRITVGHLRLKKMVRYQVSTASPLRIAKVLLREVSQDSSVWIYAPAAVILEMLGRILGWYDYFLKKKNPYVWDVALSTKQLTRT